METPSSTPPRGQARTSPSRFANIQSNVRNLLRASSVYPETAVGSPNNTPQVPRVPFLRRIDARIGSQRPDVEQQGVPTSFSPFGTRSGQRPYINTTEAAPERPAATYSPASLPSSWNERYEASPAIPQDGWAARGPSESRITLETREASESRRDGDHSGDADVEAQRPRRKKRRRRHHNAWVKRQNRQSIHTRYVPGADLSEQKRRVIWCAASGVFLTAMLTIYLTLALTVTSLNQSVHVMFILVILGSTILFCHSLIKLCLLKLRPQRARRPRIPEYADIHGFKPDVPIRVHLAQDEEIAAAERATAEQAAEVADLVKQPPPAYGLWRCSVRVDPNLLHWQKVETPKPSSMVTSPHEPQRQEQRSGQRRQEPGTIRRPPSYASDDGVSYIVEANPRSTVLFQQPYPFGARPPSGTHPAFRH